MGKTPRSFCLDIRRQSIDSSRWEFSRRTEMLGINRSQFKAGVSSVLSCEGSFDRAARSFTSFRTSFGPGTLNLELWYGWLRVNALQKPVGGNLVTGAL